RYGPGALPIDYPNDLDRLYERTGHGIWLHGTEPGFVNRSPLASDGCVSLSNQDFVLLHRLIGDAKLVHVVLDPKPDWINREELVIRREEFTSNLQHWYRAWSINDQTRLDAFYQIPNRTISNQAPRTLRSYNVSLNNPPSLAVEKAHLFAYPGEQNLYVAELNLGSNNLSPIKIRQYWRLMVGNRWKILIETPLLPDNLKDVEGNAGSNDEPP
ncbi:MAG: hypothetical protein QGG39_16830, partial [Candidatus Poribacteria bacterium]|nr:hypothetical protein [Candidatus Poribacteria bacterium]